MNPDVEPSTRLTDDARDRIHEAASVFVRDALGQLEAAHALPLGRRSAPWPDYLTIWDVLGHDPGADLAATLLAEAPMLTDRLGAPSHRQAKGYPMALLRAVVAASTLQRNEAQGWRDAGLETPGSLADEQRIVTQCTDEMLAQIESGTGTVRMIHVVTDLEARPVDGEVVEGVRLRSLRGDTTRAVSRELPEAVWEAERQDFGWHTGGHRGTLLVAEASGPGDTWLLAFDLEARLRRVEGAIRLKTAGTVLETVQLRGQPSLVHVDGPAVYRLTEEDGTYWRRRPHLQPADLPGLRALVTTIAELEAAPPKLISPILVAIGRHGRSLRPATWQDRVIDLAIGLEAVLGLDNETEGITLALRSRAAHLLALPDDPASTIFRDVGELYSLRSKVVHGRVVPASLWDNLFRRRGLTQTTVIADDRLAIVLDRWRDLLRRAIIARLMLGSEPMIWPHVGNRVVVDGMRTDVEIDRALVDPLERSRWTTAVADRATACGLADAWRIADPLRDHLHDPEVR